MRAFAGRNVDSHAGAADRKRSLEFTLCDQAADSQTDSVEHKVGVLVRVASRHNADVCNLPPFFAKVFANGLLERVSREIGSYKQVFILNSFHSGINLRFFLIIPRNAAACKRFLCGKSDKSKKSKKQKSMKTEKRKSVKLEKRKPASAPRIDVLKKKKHRNVRTSSLHIIIKLPT